MEEARDQLLEQVVAGVGRPLSRSGSSVAPDPVNLPMIRHWVDAFDDRNPVYLDEAAARASRFGGLVAPPAMLQTWTMGRPRIEGIAERGGAADEIDPDSPLAVLAAAGYTGTLATNSELEFVRYLRLGDLLTSSTTLEAVSPRKTTGLGVGYFVTWVTAYTDQHDAVVGRQRFRIFKFRPGAPAERTAPGPRPGVGTAAGTEAGGGGADDRPVVDLPEFVLDVTATVVVAGAIATRDFMPVHHDRDYARAQGAPDVFMNILSTNAYLARYVTDWAGPDAALATIGIRLGAPAVPGAPLRFTGRVTADRTDAVGRHVEVAVAATGALGPHATGAVTLTLPA